MCSNIFAKLLEEKWKCEEEHLAELKKQNDWPKERRN